MRTGALFAVFVWLSTGCGSSPVKDTPLAGKINGIAFTATTALGSHRKAFSTEEAPELWVDIYETTVTCAAFPTADRQIIAVVPWSGPTSYDLSLQKNLTLVWKEGTTPHNQIVTDGRIELSATPAAPATTPLLLRASSGPDNTVEGRIDLQICD
jgi:hypothetical protein